MIDNRNFGEKISDIVAHFGGSWKFIFIFMIVITAWLTINTLAFFQDISFDKPPYILLNLILSFVAAFQAPFIMMSQNRAEKKQDLAYRELFVEIKELVQQDLDTEIEIHNMEKYIMRELDAVKKQQHQLLLALKEAIALEKLNREAIVEILQNQEEEE